MIRPDMPPPISHAMWMVAAPSTSIVAGMYGLIGHSGDAFGRYKHTGVVDIRMQEREISNSW